MDLLRPSYTQDRLNPSSTFSAIWFFATLLPVLNIIPINNIIAERYLYIPGIGFTMLFGSILTHSISGHGIYKLFRIGLIAIVFPLFIWSTVSRNRMWLNEFTFSTETIRRSPASFKIYKTWVFFTTTKG